MKRDKSIKKIKMIPKNIRDYGNICVFCNAKIEDGKEAIIYADEIYCSMDCFDQHGWLLSNF